MKDDHDQRGDLDMNRGGEGGFLFVEGCINNHLNKY